MKPNTAFTQAAIKDAPNVSRYDASARGSVPTGAAMLIATRTSRGVEPAAAAMLPAEVGTNSSGPCSPTI